MVSSIRVSPYIFLVCLISIVNLESVSMIGGYLDRVVNVTLHIQLFSTPRNTITTKA